MVVPNIVVDSTIYIHYCDLLVVWTRNIRLFSNTLLVLIVNFSTIPGPNIYAFDCYKYYVCNKSSIAQIFQIATRFELHNNSGKGIVTLEK